MSKITPAHYTVRDMGYETPCWVWAKGLRADGYGMYSTKGRRVSAHREMYKQKVGPIPVGHHVHHLCETKVCVNPEHLETLSPSAHGRIGKQSRHLNALTEEDKAVIRLSSLTNRQIAQLLGITAFAVSTIRNTTVTRA